MSMLLIGRAMPPLLPASGLRRHYLVTKATGVQDLQMGRQYLVNGVVGDEPYRRDFDHRAPGFAPLCLGEPNRNHGDQTFHFSNPANGPSASVVVRSIGYFSSTSRIDFSVTASNACNSSSTLRYCFKYVQAMPMACMRPMGRSLPRTTRERILLLACCNSASVMPSRCTSVRTLR